MGAPEEANGICLITTRELLELDLGQGQIHFDSNTTNHYHFRCDRCGQLSDLEQPVNTAMEERVARETGHNVTHHVLEVRGICKYCNK